MASQNKGVCLRAAPVVDVRCWPKADVPRCTAHAASCEVAASDPKYFAQGLGSAVSNLISLGQRPIFLQVHKSLNLAACSNARL